MHYGRFHRDVNPARGGGSIDLVHAQEAGNDTIPVDVPPVVPEDVPVEPEPVQDTEPEPIEDPEPVQDPDPVKEPEPVQEPEPVNNGTARDLLEPRIHEGDRKIILEPVKEPEPVQEPEPVKEPEPVQEPEPVKDPKPVRDLDLDIDRAVNHNDTIILQPEPVKEPEPVKDIEPVKEPKPMAKPQPPRILNSVGNITTKANIGERLFIVADLTGKHGMKFNYTVTIVDVSGKAVHIGKNKGSISESGMAIPKVVWTPNRAGTFDVRIESRQVGGNLIDSKTIQFMVVDPRFKPLDADERYSITNLRIVDGSGNPLSSIRVNDTVLVSADLGNRHNFEQEFEFIVGVTGPYGYMKKSSVTGSIVPGGTFSPAIRYEFERSGFYRADIQVRIPGTLIDMVDPVNIPFTVKCSTIMSKSADDGTCLMEISHAHLADQAANEVTDIKAGDRVDMVATFKNNGDGFQKFTYVAYIQKDGIPKREYITTNVGPNRSTNSGISWTPMEDGIYKITVYARQGADSMVDFSVPVSYIIRVGDDLPAIGKISIGDPSTSGDLKVGQEVEITSRITNNQDVGQRHDYIIHVADDEGTVVHISWATQDVEAGGHADPAISWTPDGPGTYEITTFVWTSLTDTPDALASPATSTIIVEDASN